MSKTFSLKLRLIASLIAGVFLLQEVVWAAPGGPVLSVSQTPADPAKIDIPFEFASLKEIHQGRSGKLIVHIQDAHSNLSGQENLARSLDRLMAKTGSSLVLVEGADRDVSLESVRKS